MSRASESSRVARVRNLIIGGVGVLVVAVVAVGLFYVVQPPPTDVAEGTHYELLPGAAERPRTGPVTVTEFFSYGCVHCRNFDPQIESWRETLPEGVEFQRTPVAFSAPWRALAQAYFAADELGILERNHERVFDAIHGARVNLSTVAALAEFFDGNGTDAETFRRTMTSPSVQRRLEAALQRARDLQIRSVPTVVVDDRYQVSGSELSRSQVLEVADILIQRELAARRGG